MAGTKINNYSEGDKNLTSLMDSTDNQRRGYHSVSLTNWTGTGACGISAGSSIEINGTLVEFQSDESISGAVDGTLYVRISSTAFTASYTTVEPIWNDEKQGFYISTDRVLNYKIVKSGGTYTKYLLVDKTLLSVKSDSTIQTITCGSITCGPITANGGLTMATGNILLGGGNISTGGGDVSCGNASCNTVTILNSIEMNGKIVNEQTTEYFPFSSGVTHGSVFTGLSSKFPNIGGRYRASGVYGTSVIYSISRESATRIAINYGGGGLIIDQGGATTLTATLRVYV